MIAYVRWGSQILQHHGPHACHGHAHSHIHAHWQCRRPCCICQHRCPCCICQHRCPCCICQHRRPCCIRQHRRPRCIGQHSSPWCIGQHRRPCCICKHGCPCCICQHRLPCCICQHGRPYCICQYRLPPNQWHRLTYCIPEEGHGLESCTSILHLTKTMTARGAGCHFGYVSVSPVGCAVNLRPVAHLLIGCWV
ncbi:hypothetical protein DUNSADRAFT_4979 [Dunaliella salina]|uniref:Uncharacterized protein n=1 Tax=Dunaliella salina TaxID=3046 RepID=A0ABQ7GQX0_DUNSA|nr:hypothetical protein DUNSADRAFT_4979 [Dunaliella salina]|eukprot:KAF5837006.1 hypothetical protein DUNSADRAFT_4979 [Dunaliella salina]